VFGGASGVGKKYLLQHLGAQPSTKAQHKLVSLLSSSLLSLSLSLSLSLFFFFFLSSLSPQRQQTN